MGLIEDVIIFVAQVHAAETIGTPHEISGKPYIVTFLNVDREKDALYLINHVTVVAKLRMSGLI